jgi:putative CocE/NonD family hydrolase
VLAGDPIPQGLRDLASTTSGPLGPREVTTYAVEVLVDHNLALPTSVYQPEIDGPVPTVLIRTAYAKELLLTEGTFWASHGYCLVLQDTRGPASYFDEANDGEATVKWIQDQDWFNGHLGLYGMSYLGFTAWATASRCKSVIDAISVSYFSSDRVSSWYPGGSIGLDVALAWSAMQDRRSDENDVDADKLEPPVAALEAYLHLPLIDADKALTGREIPFYRERLTHRRDDPHWNPLDFSHVLSNECPPTLLLGGWYDYQRRYLWEDYRRLREAGAAHRLVLGPWMHAGGRPEINAESLRWFDTYVQQRTNVDQPPVSFYVTGSEDWREVNDWPEPDADARRWYLVADGGLASAPCEQSPPTRYNYDPTDPTPSVGLASFDPERAMPCDNRTLEERPDVVTFTSNVLQEPLTLFGPVSATLWVKSSAESADFFVRMTDVHPDGASVNVIDALRRVETDDRLRIGVEPLKLEIDLGPCAHSFKAGHRLRVQVSSGAFPFYARNLGTDEDLATGTRVFVAEQTLFHDHQFPAHVVAVIASSLADHR